MGSSASGRQGCDRRGQPVDTEHISPSLDQVLSTLRRRAPWVLVCFLVVTVAAFAFSKAQTKRYTATASLVFNNDQLGQQAAGLQPVSVNNQQAQQSTNVKLVLLGDMAQRTATTLGGGLTKEKVSESL